MTRRWLEVSLLACLGLTAGCGGGNAIFNVDVWSFINTSSADTLPYVVPPFVSNVTVSNVPQKISLVPGAGGSLADTVTVQGTVSFINATGSGNLSVQIYLASDSLTAADSASAGVFPVPITATVTPNTTTPVPIGPINLTAKFDSLFTQSAIWFRLSTTLSNSGATTVQGNAVITALTVRVVVNPKIF
jgi:hypothetical protein